MMNSGHNTPLADAMNIFSKKAAHVIWVLALVFRCLRFSGHRTKRLDVQVELECTVFVVDSQGRSVVPGAKVV